MRSRKLFMTRRELLAAAAAGAAVLGAAKRVMVAAHPWVYAAPRPQYDIYGILDQIFADMHYAGMDAIELMHTALAPDGAVERIRELSKRNSLPVIGTSYSAQMWDREQHPAILFEAATLVPRLQAVGGRTWGTTVGKAPARKTEAQMDAQAELLKKLIRMCSDHGIVLNLHNHTFEVEDGEYDLKGTLARIPDAKLGPDLNWLIRAKVDPVDFIHRYGQRIVYAHLRDQLANGAWSEAMGEGVTDYAAIGRAFREIGFAGDVAIELAHPADLKLSRPLRDSLRMSREYVRKTMGY